MKKRKDLSQAQLFESMYAPVQTYEKNDQESIKFVKNEEKQLRKELYGYKGRLRQFLVKSWKFLFGYFAEEWIYLAILGILVALISYMIDKGVFMCNNAKVWLYRDLAEHPWACYFGWISLPVCLLMFDAGFVKIVSEKAIGSGIPEIKTILRGVYIDDFLSFRAMIAKIVGITSTLGSGMPLGKEGPLIHISCCCAKFLGKLTSFQQIYQNENRRLEMYAAAAAVGVACTFGAPIGGVLLSVEITTSYYRVRNYWRGFCTAIWGATVYRLLLVWIEGLESVTVVFQTSFFVDTPFAAQELLVFAILGIICGLGGAFYMRMRITFGRWLTNNKAIKNIRRANVFIYSGFIALVVSSITFPLGIGQFVGGHMGYAVQVTNLFSNFSWTADNLTVTQMEVVRNWQTKHTGIYLHLICLIAYNFVCSILAASMPIPNGSFIPNFRMGAATGRILGELMCTWYPTGLSYYGRTTKIIPGGYAIVGAAAFSGAVTQTMSVAVIILEMTRQITHTIPILIAVLIANGIAQMLGPSVYDSVIKAKKLPYLPDLLPSSSAIYSVYVEDFMVRNLKFIHHGMKFEKLKELLKENRDLKSFPLVDNQQKLILLGSIQRHQLIRLFDRHLGKYRRLEELTYQEEKIFEKREENFIENPAYQGPKQNRSPSKPRRRICDLPRDLQKQWEMEQMRRPVDFGLCQIDPAPFQLVEKTSLLKVHTLFSLVGLNFAYVTSLGRLIGVVSLNDLRKAIEDVKNGTLQPHAIEIVVGHEA